jgi:hypothetical protein
MPLAACSEAVRYSILIDGIGSDLVSRAKPLRRIVRNYI